jgi:hypothetical protein
MRGDRTGPIIFSTAPAGGQSDQRPRARSLLMTSCREGPWRLLEGADVTIAQPVLDQLEQYPGSRPQVWCSSPALTACLST